MKQLKHQSTTQRGQLRTLKRRKVQHKPRRSIHNQKKLRIVTAGTSEGIRNKIKDNALDHTFIPQDTSLNQDFSDNTTQPTIYTTIHKKYGNDYDGMVHSMRKRLLGILQQNDNKISSNFTTPILEQPSTQHLNKTQNNTTLFDLVDDQMVQFAENAMLKANGKENEQQIDKISDLLFSDDNHDMTTPSPFGQDLPRAHIFLKRRLRRKKQQDHLTAQIQLTTNNNYAEIENDDGTIDYLFATTPGGAVNNGQYIENTVVPKTRRKHFMDSIMRGLLKKKQKRKKILGDDMNNNNNNTFNTALFDTHAKALEEYADGMAMLHNLTKTAALRHKKRRYVHSQGGFVFTTAQQQQRKRRRRLTSGLASSINNITSKYRTGFRQMARPFAKGIWSIFGNTMRTMSTTTNNNNNNTSNTTNNTTTTTFNQQKRTTNPLVDDINRLYSPTVQTLKESHRFDFTFLYSKHPIFQVPPKDLQFVEFNPIYTRNPHLAKQPSFFDPSHTAHRYYERCFEKTPAKQLFTDLQNLYQQRQYKSISTLFRQNRHDYLLTQETHWCYLLNALIVGNEEVEFLDHLTYLLAYKPVNWCADPRIVAYIIAGCFRFNLQGTLTAILTKHLNPMGEDISMISDHGITRMVAFQPETLLPSTLLFAFRYLLSSAWGSVAHHFQHYSNDMGKSRINNIASERGNSHHQHNDEDEQINSRHTRGHAQHSQQQVTHLWRHETFLELIEIQSYYNLACAQQDPYYSELFTQVVRNQEHRRNVKTGQGTTDISNVQLNKVYPGLYRNVNLNHNLPFDTPLNVIVLTQFEALLQQLGLFWSGEYNQALSTTFYTNNNNTMDSLQFSTRFTSFLPKLQVKNTGEDCDEAIANGDAIVDPDTGEVMQIIKKKNKNIEGEGEEKQQQHQNNDDENIELSKRYQPKLEYLPVQTTLRANDQTTAILNVQMANQHNIVHFQAIGESMLTNSVPVDLYADQSFFERLQSLTKLNPVYYHDDYEAFVEYKHIAEDVLDNMEELEKQDTTTWEEKTSKNPLLNPTSSIIDNNISNKNKNNNALSLVNNNNKKNNYKITTAQNKLKTVLQGPGFVFGYGSSYFNPKYVSLTQTLPNLHQSSLSFSRLYGVDPMTTFDNATAPPPSFYAESALSTLVVPTTTTTTEDNENNNNSNNNNKPQRQKVISDRANDALDIMAAEGAKYRAISNAEAFHLFQKNETAFATPPPLINPRILSLAVREVSAKGLAPPEFAEHFEQPFQRLKLPKMPILRSFESNIIDEHGTIITGPFAGYNPMFLSTVAPRDLQKAQQLHGIDSPSAAVGVGGTTATDLALNDAIVEPTKQRKNKKLLEFAEQYGLEEKLSIDNNDNKKKNKNKKDGNNNNNNTELIDILDKKNKDNNNKDVYQHYDLLSAVNNIINDNDLLERQRQQKIRKRIYQQLQQTYQVNPIAIRHELVEVVDSDVSAVGKAVYDFLQETEEDNQKSMNNNNNDDDATSSDTNSENDDDNDLQQQQQHDFDLDNENDIENHNVKKSLILFQDKKQKHQLQDKNIINYKTKRNIVNKFERFIVKPLSTVDTNLPLFAKLASEQNATDISNRDLQHYISPPLKTIQIPEASLLDDDDGHVDQYTKPNKKSKNTNNNNSQNILKKDIMKKLEQEDTLRFHYLRMLTYGFNIDPMGACFEQSTFTLLDKSEIFPIVPQPNYIQKKPITPPLIARQRYAEQGRDQWYANGGDIDEFGVEQHNSGVNNENVNSAYRTAQTADSTDGIGGEDAVRLMEVKVPVKFTMTEIINHNKKNKKDLSSTTTKQQQAFMFQRQFVNLDLLYKDIAVVYDTFTDADFTPCINQYTGQFRLKALKKFKQYYFSKKQNQNENDNFENNNHEQKQQNFLNSLESNLRKDMSTDEALMYLLAGYLEIVDDDDDDDESNIENNNNSQQQKQKEKFISSFDTLKKTFLQNVDEIFSKYMFKHMDDATEEEYNKWYAETMYSGNKSPYHIENNNDSIDYTNNSNNTHKNQNNKKNNKNHKKTSLTLNDVIAICYVFGYTSDNVLNLFTSLISLQDRYQSGFFTQQYKNFNLLPISPCLPLYDGRAADNRPRSKEVDKKVRHPKAAEALAMGLMGVNVDDTIITNTDSISNSPISPLFEMKKDIYSTIDYSTLPQHLVELARATAAVKEEQQQLQQQQQQNGDTNNNNTNTTPSTPTTLQKERKDIDHPTKVIVDDSFTSYETLQTVVSYNEVDLLKDPYYDALADRLGTPFSPFYRSIPQPLVIVDPEDSSSAIVTSDSHRPASLLSSIGYPTLDLLPPVYTKAQSQIKAIAVERQYALQEKLVKAFQEQVKYKQTLQQQKEKEQEEQKKLEQNNNNPQQQQQQQQQPKKPFQVQIKVDHNKSLTNVQFSQRASSILNYLSEISVKQGDLVQKLELIEQDYQQRFSLDPDDNMFKLVQLINHVKQFRLVEDTLTRSHLYDHQKEKVLQALLKRAQESPVGQANIYPDLPPSLFTKDKSLPAWCQPFKFIGDVTDIYSGPQRDFMNNNNNNNNNEYNNFNQNNELQQDQQQQLNQRDILLFKTIKRKNFNPQHYIDIEALDADGNVIIPTTTNNKPFVPWHHRPDPSIAKERTAMLINRGTALQTGPNFTNSSTNNGSGSFIQDDINNDDDAIPLDSNHNNLGGVVSYSTGKAQHGYNNAGHTPLVEANKIPRKWEKQKRTLLNTNTLNHVPLQTKSDSHLPGPLHKILSKLYTSLFTTAIKTISARKSISTRYNAEYYGYLMRHAEDITIDTSLSPPLPTRFGVTEYPALTSEFHDADKKYVVKQLNKRLRWEQQKEKEQQLLLSSSSQDEQTRLMNLFGNKANKTSLLIQRAQFVAGEWVDLPTLGHIDVFSDLNDNYQNENENGDQDGNTNIIRKQKKYYFDDLDFLDPRSERAQIIIQRRMERAKELTQEINEERFGLNKLFATADAQNDIITTNTNNKTNKPHNTLANDTTLSSEDGQSSNNSSNNELINDNSGSSSDDNNEIIVSKPHHQKLRELAQIKHDIAVFMTEVYNDFTTSCVELSRQSLLLPIISQQQQQQDQNITKKIDYSTDLINGPLSLQTSPLPMSVARIPAKIPYIVPDVYGNIIKNFTATPRAIAKIELGSGLAGLLPPYMSIPLTADSLRFSHTRGLVYNVLTPLLAYNNKKIKKMLKTRIQAQKQKELQRLNNGPYGGHNGQGITTRRLYGLDYLKKIYNNKNNIVKKYNNMTSLLTTNDVLDLFKSIKNKPYTVPHTPLFPNQHTWTTSQVVTQYNIFDTADDSQHNRNEQLYNIFTSHATYKQQQLQDALQDYELLNKTTPFKSTIYQENERYWYVLQDLAQTPLIPHYLFQEKQSLLTSLKAPDRFTAYLEFYNRLMDLYSSYWTLYEADKASKEDQFKHTILNFFNTKQKIKTTITTTTSQNTTIPLTSGNVVLNTNNGHGNNATTTTTMQYEYPTRFQSQLKLLYHPFAYHDFVVGLVSSTATSQQFIDKQIQKAKQLKKQQNKLTLLTNDNNTSISSQTSEDSQTDSGSNNNSNDDNNNNNTNNDTTIPIEEDAELELSLQPPAQPIVALYPTFRPKTQKLQKNQNFNESLENSTNVVTNQQLSAITQSFIQHFDTYYSDYITAHPLFTGTKQVVHLTQQQEQEELEKKQKEEEEQKQKEQQEESEKASKQQQQRPQRMKRRDMIFAVADIDAKKAAAAAAAAEDAEKKQQEQILDNVQQLQEQNKNILYWSIPLFEGIDFDNALLDDAAREILTMDDNTPISPIIQHSASQHLLKQLHYQQTQQNNSNDRYKDKYNNNNNTQQTFDGGAINEEHAMLLKSLQDVGYKFNLFSSASKPLHKSKQKNNSNNPHLSNQQVSDVASSLLASISASSGGLTKNLTSAYFALIVYLKTIALNLPHQMPIFNAMTTSIGRTRNPLLIQHMMEIASKCGRLPPQVAERALLFAFSGVERNQDDVMTEVTQIKAAQYQQQQQQQQQQTTTVHQNKQHYTGGRSGAYHQVIDVEMTNGNGNNNTSNYLTTISNQTSTNQPLITNNSPTTQSNNQQGGLLDLTQAQQTYQKQTTTNYENYLQQQAHQELLMQTHAQSLLNKHYILQGIAAHCTTPRGAIPLLEECSNTSALNKSLIIIHSFIHNNFSNLYKEIQRYNNQRLVLYKLPAPTLQRRLLERGKFVPLHEIQKVTKETFFTLYKYSRPAKQLPLFVSLPAQHPSVVIKEDNINVYLKLQFYKAKFMHDNITKQLQEYNKTVQVQYQRHIDVLTQQCGLQDPDDFDEINKIEKFNFVAQESKAVLNKSIEFQNHLLKQQKDLYEIMVDCLDDDVVVVTNDNNNNNYNNNDEQQYFQDNAIDAIVEHQQEHNKHKHDDNDDDDAIPLSIDEATKSKQAQNTQKKQQQQQRFGHNDHHPRLNHHHRRRRRGLSNLTPHDFEQITVEMATSVVQHDIQLIYHSHYPLLPLTTSLWASSEKPFTVHKSQFRFTTDEMKKRFGHDYDVTTGTSTKLKALGLDEDDDYGSRQQDNNNHNNYESEDDLVNDVADFFNSADDDDDDDDDSNEDDQQQQNNTNKRRINNQRRNNNSRNTHNNSNTGEVDLFEAVFADKSEKDEADEVDFDDIESWFGSDAKKFGHGGQLFNQRGMRTNLKRSVNTNKYNKGINANPNSRNRKKMNLKENITPQQALPNLPIVSLLLATSTRFVEMQRQWYYIDMQRGHYKKTPTPPPPQTTAQLFQQQYQELLQQREQDLYYATYGDGSGISNNNTSNNIDDGVNNNDANSNSSATSKSIRDLTDIKHTLSSPSQANFVVNSFIFRHYLSLNIQAAQNKQKIPYPDIYTMLQTSEDVIKHTKAFIDEQSLALEIQSVESNNNNNNITKTKRVLSQKEKDILLSKLIALTPAEDQFAIDLRQDELRGMLYNVLTPFSFHHNPLLNEIAAAAAGNTNNNNNDPSKANALSYSENYVIPCDSAADHLSTMSLTHFFNSHVFECNKHIPLEMLPYYPLTTKRLVSCVLEFTAHYLNLVHFQPEFVVKKKKQVNNGNNNNIIVEKENKNNNLSFDDENIPTPRSVMLRGTAGDHREHIRDKFDSALYEAKHGELIDEKNNNDNISNENHNNHKNSFDRQFDPARDSKDLVYKYSLQQGLEQQPRFDLRSDTEIVNDDWEYPHILQPCTTLPIERFYSPANDIVLALVSLHATSGDLKGMLETLQKLIEHNDLLYQQQLTQLKIKEKEFIKTQLQQHQQKVSFGSGAVVKTENLLEYNYDLINENNNNNIQNNNNNAVGGGSGESIPNNNNSNNKDDLIDPDSDESIPTIKTTKQKQHVSTPTSAATTTTTQTKRQIRSVDDVVHEYEVELIPPTNYTDIRENSFVILAKFFTQAGAPRYALKMFQAINQYLPPHICDVMDTIDEYLSYKEQVIRGNHGSSNNDDNDMIVDGDAILKKINKNTNINNNPNNKDNKRNGHQQDDAYLTFEDNSNGYNDNDNDDHSTTTNKYKSKKTKINTIDDIIKSLSFHPSLGEGAAMANILASFVQLFGSFAYNNINYFITPMNVAKTPPLLTYTPTSSTTTTTTTKAANTAGANVVDTTLVESNKNGDDSKKEETTVVPQSNGNNNNAVPTHFAIKKHSKYGLMLIDSNTLLESNYDNVNHKNETNNNNNTNNDETQDKEIISFFTTPNIIKNNKTLKIINTMPTILQRNNQQRLADIHYTATIRGNLTKYIRTLDKTITRTQTRLVWSSIANGKFGEALYWSANSTFGTSLTLDYSLLISLEIFSRQIFENMNTVMLYYIDHKINLLNKTKTMLLTTTACRPDDCKNALQLCGLEQQGEEEGKLLSTLVSSNKNNTADNNKSSSSIVLSTNIAVPSTFPYFHAQDDLLAKHKEILTSLKPSQYKKLLAQCDVELLNLLKQKKIIADEYNNVNGDSTTIDAERRGDGMNQLNYIEMLQTILPQINKGHFSTSLNNKDKNNKNSKEMGVNDIDGNTTVNDLSKDEASTRLFEHILGLVDIEEDENNKKNISNSNNNNDDDGNKPKQSNAFIKFNNAYHLGPSAIVSSEQQQQQQEEPNKNDNNTNTTNQTAPVVMQDVDVFMKENTQMNAKTATNNQNNNNINSNQNLNVYSHIPTHSKATSTALLSILVDNPTMYMTLPGLLLHYNDLQQVLKKIANRSLFRAFVTKEFHIPSSLLFKMMLYFGRVEEKYYKQQEQEEQQGYSNTTGNSNNNTRMNNNNNSSINNNQQKELSIEAFMREHIETITEEGIFEKLIEFIRSHQREHGVTSKKIKKKASSSSSSSTSGLNNSNSDDECSDDLYNYDLDDLMNGSKDNTNAKVNSGSSNNNNKTKKTIISTKTATPTDGIDISGNNNDDYDDDNSAQKGKRLHGVLKESLLSKIGIGDDDDDDVDNDDGNTDISEDSQQTEPTSDDIDDDNNINNNTNQNKQNNNNNNNNTRHNNNNNNSKLDNRDQDIINELQCFMELYEEMFELLEQIFPWHAAPHKNPAQSLKFHGKHHFESSAGIYSYLNITPYEDLINNNNTSQHQNQNENKNKENNNEINNNNSTTTNDDNDLYYSGLLEQIQRFVLYTDVLTPLDYTTSVAQLPPKPGREIFAYDDTTIQTLSTYSNNVNTLSTVPYAYHSYNGEVTSALQHYYIQQAAANDKKNSNNNNNNNSHSQQQQRGNNNTRSSNSNNNNTNSNINNDQSFYNNNNNNKSSTSTQQQGQQRFNNNNNNRIDNNNNNITHDQDDDNDDDDEAIGPTTITSPAAVRKPGYVPPSAFTITKQPQQQQQKTKSLNNNNTGNKNNTTTSTINNNNNNNMTGKGGNNKTYGYSNNNNRTNSNNKNNNTNNKTSGGSYKNHQNNYNNNNNTSSQQQNIDPIAQYATTNNAYKPRGGFNPAAAYGSVPRGTAYTSNTNNNNNNKRSNNNNNNNY